MYIHVCCILTMLYDVRMKMPHIQISHSGERSRVQNVERSRECVFETSLSLAVVACGVERAATIQL